MGFRVLHCALALEDGGDGFEEDLDIQREAPVGDVLRVQLDDFLKVRDLAAAADLPHAGDAGLDREARTVVELVFFPLVHRGRAGADEAHVAGQDVEEELWKLIQA